MKVSNKIGNTPPKIKDILFVCSGNTCRSPLAEGLLKRLLKEGNISGISVSSAGTSALTGTSASYNAIKVAYEEGIDISDHKARALTSEMIAKPDLIVTMEEGHKQDILAHSPKAKPKVFLLRNFAQFGSKTRNIFDPYGANIENYRFCFQDIKECVMGIYQMLRTQNKQK